MAEPMRRKILVVEDDVALANLLKRVLEASGYIVHTVDGGLAALTNAEDAPPDLVILELRLPDISGYEVCRKLRQNSNPWTLPILILTGLDKPSDQLRGFAHGADAYLTKPCEMQELRSTVARLLGQPEPDPFAIT